MFVRRGMTSKSLEPPYSGPFPVTKKLNKTLVVNIPGKNVTVSIDRLKPAYIIPEENQLEDSSRRENQRDDNQHKEIGNNKNQQWNDNQHEEDGTNQNQQWKMRETKSDRRVRFPNYLQGGFS